MSLTDETRKAAEAANVPGAKLPRLALSGLLDNKTEASVSALRRELDSESPDRWNRMAVEARLSALESEVRALRALVTPLDPGTLPDDQLSRGSPLFQKIHDRIAEQMGEPGGEG